MNRRTILKAIIPVVVAMFLGARRCLGNASNRRINLQEAKRFSRGGIISLKLTPWMIGTKVFIDGVEIKKVATVNCNGSYIIVNEPERLFTGLWRPGMPENQVMPTRRITSNNITIELPATEAELLKWPQYRKMKGIA